MDGFQNLDLLATSAFKIKKMYRVEIISVMQAEKHKGKVEDALKSAKKRGYRAIVDAFKMTTHTERERVTEQGLDEDGIHRRDEETMIISTVRALLTNYSGKHYSPKRTVARGFGKERTPYLQKQ